jgi:hypothetical protein
MLSTFIAMPALSESEHSDRLKEESDILHRKYCTNGSRHPSRSNVSSKTSCSFILITFSIEGRSYCIPGSYAPPLSEKRNSFLRLSKNKGFKDESMTKAGLYAIGTSTTLESNKSLFPNTLSGRTLLYEPPQSRPVSGAEHLYRSAPITTEIPACHPDAMASLLLRSTWQI